jgi:hypothetical protein
MVHQLIASHHHHCQRKLDQDMRPCRSQAIISHEILQSKLFTVHSYSFSSVLVHEITYRKQMLPQRGGKEEPVLSS